MKYRISRSAARDLFEIGQYTVREWGIIQAELYLDGLQMRFQWLATNKAVWRKRPGIPNNLYSYHHERHVIFFNERDDCMQVVRVLHEQMDVDHNLSNT